MLAQNAMKFLAVSALDIRARGQNDPNPVPSPCLSVCQMDEDTALCQGCLRTLDEIRVWGNADSQQRLTIWANIEARLAQYSQ
ncbi:DUF1289 domain-containing protein [Rhodoferax sp. U11-2br]|uniref:DUF1289 domain-containing protein n=1 Tax=Rhodoferax sp. U11-2br TaxID=2838878 RepID=UPI0020367830|nr:DUF1289 domain-containing protein [Rhodoferax sp. U11-2br]